MLKQNFNDKFFRGKSETNVLTEGTYEIKNIQKFTRKNLKDK